MLRVRARCRLTADEETESGASGTPQIMVVSARNVQDGMASAEVQDRCIFQPDELEFSSD